MKRDWENKKLGEIIELVYGKPLPDGKRNIHGTYPIYGANGEKGRTNEFYHNKKTIIVGRKGSAGELNLTEEKFWPLDVTYFVTFNEKRHDLVFLYHLLGLLELPKFAKGVKPGINRNEVYSINVQVPPLPEQQRIVAILDEVFASIAKAKANAEQNLKNTKELYESYSKSMFANRGKAWQEKRLGDVCEYNKMPNKKTDLPYVGLEDIQSNTGKLVGPPTPRSVKSLTFNFTKEHVLYGRLRPYLNKVLLPEFEGHCSTEIFPIRPKSGILSRNYLFHWLISSETMTRINATWTGATLPRANMNTVLDFKLLVPTLADQEIIIQKLDSISRETKKLESIYLQKLNALEELKKSVLRKAFNGELKTEKN